MNMSLSSKFISKHLQLIHSSILIFACLLSYGPYLNGDFVFDDAVAIVRNKDVTNKSGVLSDLFKSDFWGFPINSNISHMSYRPLTTLMFRIESQTFGLNPFMMKSVNLSLHITITLLLMPFLRRVLEFKDQSLVIYAASLFAVHPIHVEAVSGIVSRAELMVCLLYLMGVTCYCVAANDKKVSVSKQAILLAFVVFLQSLAILFKETGIVILPTCIFIDLLKNSKILDFLRRRNKNLKISQPAAVRTACLAVITITHVYVRLKIINFNSPTFKLQDNPLAAHKSFIVRTLTQQYLYALNFWLMLCPDWLCFDWAIGSIPLINEIGDYRVFCIVLFQIGLLALFLRGNKTVILALGVLIVPFLPASGIVKVGFVIAERVLYIPSIGYCILIAMGFNGLLINFARHRKIFQSCFAGMLVIFMLRTQQRASEWQTEEKLFRSALRVVPDNAKVYYNIARLSTDKNDKQTAFTYYKKSIELYPEYEAAHMNLGNLYREIHQYELAEKCLKRSIEIMEEFPAAWMNLGIVQAAMKNYKDSLNSYHRALQLRRHYPNCLYNLGNLYLDLKNSSMALQYWHNAITLNPKHQKAWANILALLDGEGKATAVIETSETALKFLPDEPTILFSRANAFGKLKNFTESEKIFRQIIELQPNYALYHANLGVLYHRWNRKDLAMQYYSSALKLDPGLMSAKENLMKLSRTPRD